MDTTGGDEARLIRWQALSGLAFGTFLVLHLANTMIGALGEDAYNAWQVTMRWYYQFPLVVDRPDRRRGGGTRRARPLSHAAPPRARRPERRSPRRRGCGCTGRAAPSCSS